MNSLPQITVFIHNIWVPYCSQVLIEICGYKNILSDTGTQVYCISYISYSEFDIETKTYTKVKAKASLKDRSNLGPSGIVICSVMLGAHEIYHKFIVCENLLCLSVLGLDFPQNVRIGIDWNNQGQLYLCQDHTF